VALTPLVVALVRRPDAPPSLRHAFFLGLLTGSVYFTVTLYWLVETMTTFGGLANAIAFVAAALLVAYLSLFPAAFAVAIARLRRSMGVYWAVVCAAPVWVATELGRQYVWDGFPWALLGYSQVSVLPIAQVASVTGVYGLSFLLVLTASAVALVIVERDARRWKMAGAVALIVIACGVWGRSRIAGGALVSAGDPVRVGVVQGNIQQSDKWNPALRDVIIGRYIMMTRQAIERGATFIIWPESSMPVNFEDDAIRSAPIRRLARESNVTLLIGSDQEVGLQAGLRSGDAGYHAYNAAFLVKPDGTVGAVYRKMHLVPFGEYVPLQRLLFFVGPIVDKMAPFTPGDTPTLLPVGTHMASTAICYEVIFGSLIRRFVLDGSELLTTITNDAWYGRTSAAFQHWDQASMRAIENGRYLARAANTGISGFVDPYGRVVEKSPIFEQALIVQDIRFLQTRTIYSRIGDAIAWLCLAFSLGALLAAWRVGYTSVS
jgi:apolipoprotein N-acyltransferase